MLQLRVPQHKLEESLLAMHRYGRRMHVWVMGVGDRPEQDVKQLLYHDRLEPANMSAIARTKPGLVPILVETCTGLSLRARESFLQRVREMPVEGGLLFVTGGDGIKVFYFFKSAEYATGPVSLSVPGPHIEQIKVLPLDEQKIGDKQKQPGSIAEDNQEHGMETGHQEFRHENDRLAGAIGMGNIELGFELMDRASKLVVVVIGIGRAGSRLAFRLAQSGVGGEGGLTLIDPDVVGPENLEGMVVAREAVGLPKVIGVARTIAVITGGIVQPTPLYASLSDPEVLDVLRMADVVFSSVDEDGPRLATAVVASRFHAVHIDIVAGTAWTTQRQAVVGGELRAFIPGSRGCLGCFDRYDWQQALRLLGLSGEAERKRREGLDWHQQRPGSSADILMPLLGEGLQSFWGILRGDVRESFWLHYEKEHRGHPIWQDWSDRNFFGRQRGCGICRSQAGLGDMIE